MFILVMLIIGLAFILAGGVLLVADKGKALVCLCLIIGNLLNVVASVIQFMIT